MGCSFPKLMRLLIVAMVMAHPHMLALVQAQSPKNCCQSPASCRCPSCAGGFEGALANDSSGGGNEYGNSGFDLGEGAPAQSGSSLAVNSVPNMIADNTGGGCGGLFIGGALVAEVAHPTFACSRLNIAENNSPLVRDRIFYSYRHFHNGSTVDLFRYSPQGRAGDLDIDRHTFGFESRVTDNTSIEFRVPINTQLSSNLSFTQGDSGSTTNGSNNNLNSILNDRTTNIGNLDLIFKSRLSTSETFYLSGGFGLNLPTAPSVHVRGNVNDQNYQLYDPDLTLQQNAINGPLNGTPPTGDTVLLQFDGTYRNQTVNLSPFLAFVWIPDEALFTQGFVQVDVPLNESNGRLGLFLDAGGLNYDTLANPQAAKLAQQTLLRLNYGIGGWLYTSDTGYLSSLGLMFEAHYTTTLNDSDVVTLNIAQPGAISLPVLDRGLTAGFGNLENRVDVLNFVVGVPMRFGSTTIYNGFVAPAPHMDRGFDFEYMFAINRQY